MSTDPSSVQSAAGPAPAPASTRARLGADFWRLWTASTAANLGDGIRRVAFPLLAITLTRDPVLVSAVAAATTLPWLLIGPLAGLAVDRWDRLRLLWAVNAARALVLAALVAALATAHASTALLITAALLLGTGETFVDDAAQALVPRMVAPGQLERANARLYGAQVITGQFLGQGITGALFALAPFAPFTVDTAALAAATVAALALSTTSSSNPARTGPAPTAPPGRGTSAAAAPVATAVLHLGPTGFGLLLAVGASGSLIGSQLAPALRGRLGTAGAMYLGVALVTASAVGLALTRSPALATALMIANGVGVLVWNVVGVSLRQRVVPDALLGRVNAAFSMAAVGAATAGALAAGVITDAVSPPAVFWMSAAVITVPAVLTAPTLRPRKKPAGL